MNIKQYLCRQAGICIGMLLVVMSLYVVSEYSRVHYAMTYQASQVREVGIDLHRILRNTSECSIEEYSAIRAQLQHVTSSDKKSLPSKFYNYQQMTLISVLQESCRDDNAEMCMIFIKDLGSTPEEIQSFHVKVSEADTFVSAKMSLSFSEFLEYKNDIFFQRFTSI